MKNKDSLRDRDFTFLGNYEMMDPEKDWENIRRQMKRRRHHTLSILWKAAALAIMLLGMAYLSRQLGGGPGQMQLSQAGLEPLELELPDGSAVVLNRHAELRWPASFARQERQVELTGEAWFQVQKELDRPFLIEAGGLARVEVLGTSFLVRSDSGQSGVSVQVEEGTVALSALEHERGDPALLQIILHKGERAVLNQDGLKRIPESDPNYLSWLTGVLHFEQTPLARVLTSLEAHFGEAILLSPAVPEDLSFTSTIDGQELESVLEELCLVLDLQWDALDAGYRIRPQK